MVTTVAPTKRLTVQTEAIAADTTAIRSLDWDRDRFDIEFGLQNGTTYNSFIIRGEKVALVDTSHAKFRQLYLELLKGEIDPATIDYLVISHTEPDHSGLVGDILDLNPDITVVGSKVAMTFLENQVHREFQRRTVKSGDSLDLGNGHELQFLLAPNLHWPDTIFSFDTATGVLYTCDAFGLHYCSDLIYDENLAAIEKDFQFYYECLMAPNARSVTKALKGLDKLQQDYDIKLVATGHGPLLRFHLQELLGRYRTWSANQTQASTAVAVFYISDYGYSDRLTQAIARGITKTGVAVEMMDLKGADPQEAYELVGDVAGLVISMPPASGAMTEQIQAAFGTIVAAANHKQLLGLVESYGGDDEPIDPILTQFREAGLDLGFEPIRVKEEPSENTYQLCEESGTDLGQKLSQKKTNRKKQSLDSSLIQALGRISSGLYIITAQKGELRSAMLASWVSQASFEPLGFTIAVAKDRAIESLMQVGDTFVLNVLEEGNHLKLMKHFLKRFAPGADRFAEVNTQPAKNGSPILTDALTYLECTVSRRMETSDHWIVYSTVQEGRVSNQEARTASHRRKVGNYY
ncbi:diflavin flavoprotein [Synechococcus sp. PCC 7336]|uniref:diflavin flavoprotein n=1 Tax=Synechococcus sp. PCC 7336 TaxID=195250 RepID=UPI00034688A6|nr:diflavin flavoprotein [Synechococcus sp. PCC 7336]